MLALTRFTLARVPRRNALGRPTSTSVLNHNLRNFSKSDPRLALRVSDLDGKEDNAEDMSAERARPEHAVISTFDLFSIGG